MSEFFVFLHHPEANIFTSGREDMNVEAMWERLGISVENPRQYHL